MAAVFLVSGLFFVLRRSFFLFPVPECPVLKAEPGIICFLRGRLPVFCAFGGHAFCRICRFLPCHILDSFSGSFLNGFLPGFLNTILDSFLSGRLFCSLFCSLFCLSVLHLLILSSRLRHGFRLVLCLVLCLNTKPGEPFQAEHKGAYAAEAGYRLFCHLKQDGKIQIAGYARCLQRTGTSRAVCQHPVRPGRRLHGVLHLCRTDWFQYGCLAACAAAGHVYFAHIPAHKVSQGTEELFAGTVCAGNKEASAVHGNCFKPQRIGKILQGSAGNAVCSQPALVMGRDCVQFCHAQAVHGFFQLFSHGAGFCLQSEIRQGSSRVSHDYAEILLAAEASQGQCRFGPCRAEFRRQEDIGPLLRTFCIQGAEFCMEQRHAMPGPCQAVRMGKDMDAP